jgi:NitT/TauT family transport system permease protein
MMSTERLEQTVQEDEQAGPDDPSAADLVTASPRRLWRGRLTWDYWLATAMVGVAILGFAELAARQAWISNLIVPAPSEIWAALITGLTSGLYWPHIRSTVEAAATGFVITTIVAVSIAGMMSTFVPVRRVMFPYVVALHTIPIVAVAPIVILWLGFGQTGKIAVVVAVVFFPVLVNALHGLELRDRDTLQLFQSLGASRWQLFWRLRLPGAVPFLFAGLRIGAQFSLIGAVVAEFLGSQAGLGFVLLSQKAAFDAPGEFAVLAILMVIGLTLNGLLSVAEKRIAPWSPKVSASRSK